MTWFWFILFGIIGLAKREQFAKQVATWNKDSLHGTTWVCLAFWGVMGLFFLPFNEGNMWFMHAIAGFCGVLGFFTLAEYMKHSNKARADHERERIRQLRNRMRNTGQTPRQGQVAVDEPGYGGLPLEDPAEYGLGSEPGTMAANQDTGDRDASEKLIDIMQRMAEMNAGARSQSGHQPAETAPEEDPEPVAEPRDGRNKDFKVDLGLGGLLSAKPAYVEQEHIGVDLKAPMDPSPTVQEDEPPEAVEHVDREPDPPIQDPPETPEPDPVPSAAPPAEPLPEEPRQREGYTPGPARLGGVPGPVTAGPVTLGKPGPVAAPGPRKLKAGFTYQPKLIDPVIKPGTTGPTKDA